TFTRESVSQTCQTDADCTTAGFRCSMRSDFTTCPSGSTCYCVRFDGDLGGRVTSITTQGPGGTSLVWNMEWQSYSYDPQVALPTLVCTEWNNATPQLENVPCSQAGSSTRGCLRGDSCPIKYVRLTKLTQPDGRSYTFQYGTWGNLIAVDDPDGA